MAKGETASDTKVADAEPALTWGKRRRIAFYTTVGLILAVMAVTGPALTLPVTAWLPESTLEAMFGQEGLGAHRVHMEGGSLLFWLTIVAMVAQLRHPERRSAPLLAAALAWVVFLPLELSHLVDPFSIVVTGLIVMVLLLHPRARPTWAVGWRPGPRLLAIPLAALAVVYAYQQALTQLSGLPEDPHVAGSHYALMAAVAVGVAASALLGSSHIPGHAVSAWTAGVMGLVMGVFFIGHPLQASSPGVGWGAALVVWGLAYLPVAVIGSGARGLPTPSET